MPGLTNMSLMANRTTVTKYKFNSKVGGFQPTSMEVTVHDTIPTQTPQEVKDETKLDE